MKGLMFNLLDCMARDAGCTEEAWELVLEFTAAERLMFGDSPAEGTDASLDSVTPYAFDIPTEAMLRCLSQAADSDDEFDWNAVEAHAMCFTENPELAPHHELLVTGSYDALPKGFGFKAGAFSYGFHETSESDEDDFNDDPHDSLFPPARR